MTESEYLASEDPKAMRELLESRGLETEAKLRLWVEACRSEYLKRSPRSDPFTGDPLENLHAWTTSTMDANRLPMANRAHLIREIWGNPFREVIGPVDAFSNLTEEIRPLVFWRSWLTPDVITLAQIIRQGDHEAYEPLWDALHSAGCDNEEIRHHCAGRERCPDCEGDGKRLIGFHQDDDCKRCNGTGWIPLRCQHVAGCWCIQLILGDE